MAGLDIGHTGGVELNYIGAVGNESDGSGDGLLIDERLHPLRDLGKNFLVHSRSFGARGFGVGLSEGGTGEEQQEE
jgi:hypothetical protein